MQRKHLLIAIITILIVLLTTEIGILTSYVSNFINSTFKPFALPLLVINALIVASLTAWLYFLQKEADHPTLSLANQNRQHMLERVRAIWIKGVLEQSLHETALIVLGLTEQQDAIANPWRFVFQQANQPERPLPSGTHITQVYQDAGGELLILGEPGSGKTTLLLELARDLLNLAEQDDKLQMPMIFNLSSWTTKKQSISDWLIEELKTKYQVPRKLAQTWVTTDQILPLFDGLDEVASDDRAACVMAINIYRQEHMVPTVLCSRKAEYLTQPKRVILRNAVVVQLLTAQQIDDYLSSAGRQLAALRIALREDKDLQELATTPLMLSVLTLIYEGKSVEDLLERGSLTTQRRQIFEKYIERMLQRRGVETHYPSPQTKHWLVWLAKQMTKHNQTEFYLERMQVDWLSSSWSYRAYRIILGLVSGLASCLSGILAYGLVVGLIGWPSGIPEGILVGIFILSIAFGLTSQLTFRGDSKIEPTEVITWSNSRDVLAFGLGGGLIVGMFVGLASTLTFGLVVGLAAGLVFWIATGLASGISSERLDAHELLTPNQGMWRSARNGMLGATVLGLTIGLVGWLAGGLTFGWAFGLASGLIGLLMGGLTFGWNACIQHIVLRFLLWHAGSIPRNYPRFLDYTAKSILLRKVGGGYIFIHHLLQDYFASLDVELRQSEH